MRGKHERVERVFGVDMKDGALEEINRNNLYYDVDKWRLGSGKIQYMINE